MPAPTAFISDIHGNRPALQAVLAEIERARCTQVFMLGDLINGIDPQGCAGLLRNWSSTSGIELTCILGNAEAYLNVPEREKIPQRGEPWMQDMLDLIEWFENQLTKTDLEWIRSFPETLRWNNAYLVHDSPLDRLAVRAMADPEILPQHREWFYHGRGVSPDLEQPEGQELLEYMADEGLGQVFCGHTHLPWLRQIDGRVVCNLGSVGMPLDGDPRASWVLVHAETAGALDISIQRVEYDLAEQLDKIDQTPDYIDFKMQGYVEAYKQCFLSGRHWKHYIAKPGA